MGEARTSSSVRDSVGAALATADLRRLQLAWLASATGAWVFFVSLAVYAYGAYGAAGVGVAALVRMVPAGLAAPFTGMLADRASRRDVLFVALVARALILIVIAASIVGGAPAPGVLALGALFTVVATAHKPAQAALLPSLAETPRQLGASNALWSAIDNAAFLLGSLLGGLLIAVASVESAFAVTAGLFALAALPVARIARDAVPSYRAAAAVRTGALGESVRGFREVAADPRMRLVVGFLAASTLIEGAADVLVVIVAIQLLDIGGAGVGWLNACWGAGGLVGGITALTLLGRGRLAAGLGAGGLLVGVPLMAIATVANPLAAGALLVLVGVGYALIEVAGLSLLQRLSAEDVLARAFAVVESSYWFTTGLGAILTPAIVALVGVRWALVGAGACLPLLVAMRWVALVRFEAAAPVPEREFKAIRALPAFAPLPLATVENVSRLVSEVRVTAGDVVIREGESGDLFYVVADGALDVCCHEGATVLDPLGGGDYFGEIALLRDIPRTATVTARTDALLYALDRESFLCTVSAHPCTTESVDDMAARRFANAHAR
jgi:cyclic nucleotide-binding protein/MFS transporter